MSEEPEFKPIRITLSEEAMGRLEKIMNEASFRSYSSAIEECIRVVDDISRDITNVLGKKGEPVGSTVSQTIGAYTFERIVARMQRFTGRDVTRVPG